MELALERLTELGILGDCSDWTDCERRTPLRGIESRRASLHVGDDKGLGTSSTGTVIPIPAGATLVEDAFLGGGGSEPTRYELEKCS